MSFESEKPFNDFQHFARGIRRSGDFTINESNLLEQCGTAMIFTRALANQRLQKKKSL